MESRGNSPGCLGKPLPNPFGSINPLGTEGKRNGCVAGRDSFGSTLHWGPDYSTNRYPLTSTSYTSPDGKLLSKMIG